MSRVNKFCIPILAEVTIIWNDCWNIIRYTWINRYPFRNEYLNYTKVNISNKRIWIPFFSTVSRHLSMFWCIWGEVFDVQVEKTPNILYLFSYSVVYSSFYFLFSLYFSVCLSVSVFLSAPPLSLAVLCPANELRLDSTGVILSPGYPDSYPNLQMCAWTISVEKGYNISLYFEFFQTEKEFDILEVFDGN